MADLQLDSAGDLDFSANDAVVIIGAEAIRQELQVRYRFFLGEWFLNPEEGTPYFEHVLKKNANDAQVRAVLVEVAKTTPGVVEVRSFSSTLNTVTRTLTVVFQAGIITDEGLVYEPFVIEVEI
jgi:hypothetical protein